MADVAIQDLKKTSKMVAAQAGIGSVKAFFESQKGVLAAVLPKHVSADRMLKIALGAMRTTPKLMNCTVESLMGAVVQVSQLGLEPNTPLGHAYLIPFEKKKKQGNDWVVDKVEVQIVLGYKGLIDLARRSGQVVSIAAHEVCQADKFDFAYGLDEKLEHRPALGDRGPVIAFYAVAKLVGGGYAFEVMSKAQIEEIRDASQNYKMAREKPKTVWGQHFVEMGRKTVLRRLFKYLPVSIELATASALDDLSARGVSQELDVNTIDGEFTVVPGGDEYQGDQQDEEESETQAQATQTVARGQTQKQAKPSGAAAAGATYETVAAKLKAAPDAEHLDLAADFIREVADADAAAKLEDLYRELRAGFEGGDEHAAENQQTTQTTTTRGARARANLE